MHCKYTVYSGRELWNGLALYDFYEGLNVD